jgi:phage-related protein
MAMGDADGCPLHDFFTDLAKSNSKEFGKTVAFLERVADHGPPVNKEKCRYFRNEKAFELKPGGVRVMAFWDGGQMIICSHAFLKKSRKTPKRELTRLKTAKEDYFVAKQNDELVVD